MILFERLQYSIVIVDALDDYLYEAAYWDTNPRHSSCLYIVLLAQRAVHGWAVSIVCHIPHPKERVVQGSVKRITMLGVCGRWYDSFLLPVSICVSINGQDRANYAVR